MIRFQFNVSLFLCLLLLSTLSWGADAQEPSKRTTPIEQARYYEKQRNYQQAADMYLITARKMSPLQGEAWRVKAAEMSWMGGNMVQSETIMQGTDESGLNPAMLARLRIIGARIARYNQNYPEVARLLEIPIAELPTMTRKQIESLRSEASRKMPAKESRQATLNVQPAPGNFANNSDESRWESLLSLPPEELDKRLATARTPLERGWTELTFIAKSNQGVARNAALSRWRGSYPGHPATRGFMQQVESGVITATANNSILNSANRIGVLLPLSGKLANLAAVISEGISNATSNTGSGIQPHVAFYDTATLGAGGIASLYNQAVAEGAEIVIGPMDKQQVDILTQSQLSVPVVTLNYGNRVDLFNPRLFQFALLPEDEAHAAAEKISADGYKTVGVLTPASSWGKRISEAFIQKANALGLEIVTTGAFNPNTQNSSSVIQNTFGVKDNKAEKEVEAIFLAATPKQGRLIKPLLKFHFMGHIPVYATSHIFTGDNEGTSDSDLNGIRFTEIPWLLDDTNSAFPGKEVLGDVSKHYPRMFAFGFDAAKLAMQLSSSGVTPATGLRGLSGNLYPDNRNRIHRLVGWSKYERGFPKPLLLPGMP